MPKEDIERMREFLGEGWRAEPPREGHAQSGPLAGTEGIIAGKNRSRLVFSFDWIQRSMAIGMGEGNLTPV